MYTCSVMIGADEHVADSPYPVLSLHMRCAAFVFSASKSNHSSFCLILFLLLLFAQVRILSGRPFPRCCAITGEGHRLAVSSSLPKWKSFFSLTSAHFYFTKCWYRLHIILRVSMLKLSIKMEMPCTGLSVNIFL